MLARRELHEQAELSFDACAKVGGGGGKWQARGRDRNGGGEGDGRGRGLRERLGGERRANPLSCASGQRL
eukprot:scaffold156_cov25-Tisochrysis_lutea.AAC.1